MDCFAARNNHERWSTTCPQLSLMRKLEDAKDDGKDKRTETCFPRYSSPSHHSLPLHNFLIIDNFGPVGGGNSCLF